MPKFRVYAHETAFYRLAKPIEADNQEAALEQLEEALGDGGDFHELFEEIGCDGDFELDSATEV